MFFFLGYNIADLLNSKDPRAARKRAVWVGLWVVLIVLRVLI